MDLIERPKQMIRLRDDLVRDALYEMLPVHPAFAELGDLIDGLPGLSREQRLKMNSLLANLYLDTIGSAFELGWTMRSDPTALIFIKKEQ